MFQGSPYIILRSLGLRVQIPVSAFSKAVGLGLVGPEPRLQTFWGLDYASWGTFWTLMRSGVGYVAEGVVSTQRVRTAKSGHPLHPTQSSDRGL